MNGIRHLIKTGVLVDLTLLAVSLAAIYWHYIFTSATFVTDGLTDLVTLHRSTAIYSGSHLVEGKLPLWNPYWFGGYPHQAMPSSALFYPATLLYGLLDFAVAIKIDLFFHVWLLGALSYFLVRDLFSSRLTAVVAGVIMMAGGFVPTWIGSGHFWTMHVAAWMPLNLLLLRRFLQCGVWKWGLGLSALTGIQLLAGGSQQLALTLTYLAAYSVFELARLLLWKREPLSRVFRNGAFAFCAILLGLAMGAVQLIPGLELMEQSVRGKGLTFEYFNPLYKYSFLEFLRIIFFPASGNMVFPGPIALALMLFGIFHRGTSERFALIAAALFALMYSYMPEWLYESVVRHVPGLALGRLPSRMLLGFAIVTFLLIFFGMNTVVNPRDRGKAKRKWVAFTALVVLLTIGFFFHGHPYRLLFVVFSTLSTFMIVLLYTRPGSLAWTPYLLSALILTEAIIFNANNIATGSPDAFAIHPDFVSFANETPKFDRVAQMGVRNPDGVPLLQGASPMLRIRGFGGYHALVVDRLARFMNSQTHSRASATSPEGLHSGDNSRFFSKNWITIDAYHVLDLLNVRYLATLQPKLRLPAVNVGPSRRFEKRTVGELTVYENRHALGPAFIVHEAQVLASEEALLDTLKKRGFRYRKKILLSEDVNLSELRPPTGPEEVHITDYGPNHVELQATMTTPGFVVLTDLYYPGWTATIDDTTKTKIYAADMLLRGVLVDAGTHTIRFRYMPATFVAGSFISIFSLLLWIGLVFAGSRRARGAVQ